MDQGSDRKHCVLVRLGNNSPLDSLTSLVVVYFRFKQSGRNSRSSPSRPLRQCDELRRRESPLRGAATEDRGRGERNTGIRVKKRMHVCVHTTKGTSLRRKSLLHRVVGSALLSAEELQTVLVGVEAVMNSRHLGPLSQDPSDGEALTPAHLLIGGSLIAPPARWSREYVLGLQTRGKWHQQQPNLAVGDLVVVAEDNMPP
ncbi:hypothetical protein ACLKA6_017693 [Drosophila palustris]